MLPRSEIAPYPSVHRAAATEGGTGRREPSAGMLRAPLHPPAGLPLRLLSLPRERHACARLSRASAFCKEGRRSRRPQPMEIGGRVLESPHPTNPFVARDQPCSRDASWSLPGPVAGEGLGPGVAGGRHGGERLPRGDAGAALEARCLVIVKVGEMCGGFGWPAALTRERQCQREWKPRASRICVASGVRSRCPLDTFLKPC